MISRICFALLLALTFQHQAFAQSKGDKVAGQEKSVTCAACHGADGHSIAPTFPNLAGQVPGYIAQQLELFKSGERVNAQMAGMVIGLSEQDMHDLDAYYSELPSKPGAISEEQKEIAKIGEKLYRGGQVELSIASCMSCHGPTGKGIPVQYPRLAGQPIDYLVSSLLAYKSGERVNDVMNPIAFRLSEQQITALATYMHALDVDNEFVEQFKAK